jgi:hypothetical protein
MLSRFRSRLTYSNVAATLAVFIALGGTGYAAAKITSADIKNRTIQSRDVKKNALGGGVIDESKLRAVPRARTADQATSALSAATANQATSAQSALLADVASNANALAGQGAASFEKSSRTQFGSAPGSPAGVSGERVVLSWPAMGVELTSSSDACGANELQFAVKNTKSSGPDVEILDGPGGTVPANSKLARCGDEEQYEGELTDSTGRAMFVDCFLANGEIRCLGVRSEP